jgi:hypothetical protein
MVERNCEISRDVAVRQYASSLDLIMQGLVAFEARARLLARQHDMPLELLDEMALPIGRRELYYGYLDLIRQGQMKFIPEARRMVDEFGLPREPLTAAINATPLRSPSTDRRWKGLPGHGR